MPITKAKKECNRRWEINHPEQFKAIYAINHKKYYDKNRVAICEKLRNKWQFKKEWNLLLKIYTMYANLKRC